MDFVHMEYANSTSKVCKNYDRACISNRKAGSSCPTCAKAAHVVVSYGGKSFIIPQLCPDFSVDNNSTDGA